MINQHYWELAQRAAEISGIDARLIYSQWVHETGGFTSDLCKDYHNLGGLTQTTPTDAPQPDGSLWYMRFADDRQYAEYYGRYLKYYAEDGIFEAKTIQEYAEALKHGGYFGDTVEHYVDGMTAAWADAFEAGV